MHVHGVLIAGQHWQQALHVTHRRVLQLILLLGREDEALLVYERHQRVDIKRALRKRSGSEAGRASAS